MKNRRLQLFHLALLLIWTAPVFSLDVWLKGDYLAWFTKSSPQPVPLVTFASFDDAIPGAIGQGHTRILLGKESFDIGWLQGFQIQAGSWIDSSLGIEAAYFFFPSVTKKKTVTTSGQPGSPNLAVPLFDTTGVLGLNGIPGETIYILPGPIEDTPFFSAFFNDKLSCQLQGAEIDGFYLLQKNSHFTTKGLWGMRWIQWKETLIFYANTATVPNSPDTPNASTFMDLFHTNNNYLAAEFGLKGAFNASWWQLEAALKGSFGASFEKLRISGASTTKTGTVWFTTAGTANEILKGGIFAEPSNIGTHKKSPFAYGMEASLESTFTISKSWAFDIGYTFLWISQVLRPGDQMDRKINSTRAILAEASRATTGTGSGPIPFGTPGSAPAAEGAKYPRARFKPSPFWAQGINGGLTFTF